MALFVVDRNLQPLRKLGREEFEQAANFYAGAVVSAPQIIRDVRRDRYWLQCDCREPRPVMNVALRDEGRYVLRNNPDAAEHAPIAVLSVKSQEMETAAMITVTL